MFRIGLGCLVLMDAAMRWPDVVAFYSDDGYFTRAMVDSYFTQTVGPDWRSAVWSLHLLSGDTTWQVTLFIAQAVCGVMLMLGLFTRLANIVAWILVASLQIRCPIIITSGDFILKLMLFWSMFMPLGRYWSLDNVLFRNRRHSELLSPQWFCTWATAGYVLQLIFLYFFTGIAKWNEVWFGGNAMSYVLHLDIFLRPFGKQMLQYPFLLKLVSWGTLFIEVFAIWLLLVPWRNSTWRLLVMICYGVFHFGIALCMAIGLFPWICFVLWLPTIPFELWSRLARTSTVFVLKPPENGWRGLLNSTINAYCGVMIGIVLLWNVANLKDFGLQNWRIPKPIRVLALWSAIDQRFQMFGVPPPYSPWFVYEARLFDGSKVDLLRPSHRLSFDPPEDNRNEFADHNWRQLHFRLSEVPYAEFRKPLLDYMVQQWNRSNLSTRHVAMAKLHCYIQKTGPDFESRSIVSSVWGTWHAPDSPTGSLFDELSNQLDSENRIPINLP